MYVTDSRIGVDGQTFTVTIVSSPAGTPVNEFNNTFDYPILSNNVTLTCNVTSNDTSAFAVTSYQWNTTGCYTHPGFNNGNPRCFPHDKTTQSVTDDNVTAEDAGTITCTVTINGSDYTSEPFTLRISGEQLVYCVITCIVYCKQCCLLATCYCCIMHQSLWLMYKAVFTVGIALIGVMYDNDGDRISNAIDSDNAIGDYSYVNARDGTISMSQQLARCVTGLGPSDTDDNSVLGGLYFNGTAVPNVQCGGSSSPIIRQQPAGLNNLGVINMVQCVNKNFSTIVEGIYTCVMMNSSMMNETISFAVYFRGRSESLDLYYIHSLNLSTQLLQ